LAEFTYEEVVVINNHLTTLPWNNEATLFEAFRQPVVFHDVLMELFELHMLDLLLLNKHVQVVLEHSLEVV